MRSLGWVAARLAGRCSLLSSWAVLFVTGVVVVVAITAFLVLRVQFVRIAAVDEPLGFVAPNSESVLVLSDMAVSTRLGGGQGCSYEHACA